MSQWKPLSVLFVCLWTSVPFAHSLSCGQCERGGFNDLTCPGTFSLERYTVQLDGGLFFVKCRYDAPRTNFSLISDCDFSSVKRVELHWCPMPNVSFSEIFRSIGINPKNITSFSFVNIGQRHHEQLQEWHLEGLTNLKMMEFKDNGFTAVPPLLFDGTPSLQYLILTSNLIDTLPESLFWKTPNLTRIDLHNNGLTNLPLGLFSNLTNLKNISLWENRLSQLQPELLSSVPNLLSLELTYNDISQLDPDVFAGLKEIRKIHIGSNKLEALPEVVFYSCPLLENLEFDNNSISTLPNEIFREATKMKRLNFGNNELTQIPEKMFANMKDLENLKFKRNHIATLPPRIFKGLLKLEVLDLQSNIINELPPGIFDDLVTVDTLIMQNNSLRELPDGIFKNCKSLLKLYMMYNELSTLLPTMFPNPSVMTHLDLSNNNISFSMHGPQHITVQEFFPLAHLTGLEKLMLKNNSITEMPQALNTGFGNLKVLDLNNNLISYLDHNDLTFKSDDLEIDFRHNKIKAINLNHMNFSSSKKFVKIHVKENPLVCNCELFSFALVAQGKLGDNTEVLVADAINVNCSYPGEPQRVSHIEELETESLTCKTQNCPENCTCLTRAHDKMFLVDCSYQGLQNIPPLKNEQIPEDEDYLLTLILRNNSITSLGGLGYGNYSRLVNLTIPYNRLSFINESYLLQTLKVLDVRGNNITSLPTSMLEFLNSTNVQLSLGNNPWRCDCDIAELHTFLRYPDRQILDLHNVKCPVFDNEALINLTEEDLCPLIQQPLVIATITAVAGLLLIFAILVTVSFFKYKQDIKVWLFTHRLCLWAVAEEEKDADKKYDAFISYSNKDEEFVNRVLVPGLESGDPKYKVCLHYRDWVPGEYIQNQIDQSVEASRRTIVVLSSNFIENVWGHIEFKTAHSKALKDRTNRIIVIVLGEVPPDSELDEELKLYLSTRTYLQWRDVKFWEKLRYAMPHPPDLRRKNKKQRDIEKLELAKTNPKQQSV